jgi:hypothetical protein
MSTTTIHRQQFSPDQLVIGVVGLLREHGLAVDTSDAATIVDASPVAADLLRSLGVEPDLTAWR